MLKLRRYDIINKLIVSRNFKSYLEIGVRNKEKCFNKINCENKFCVDPDKNSFPSYLGTSDQFFEENKQYFDIIFIDGLHLCEQVEKDIHNSLLSLNPNGIIVLHDCLPDCEATQNRIQNPLKPWTGDVWKAWIKYRKDSCYKTYTINLDWGIGIIDTSIQENSFQQDLDIKCSFATFSKNKNSYLNLKSDIIY